MKYLDVNVTMGPDMHLARCNTSKDLIALLDSYRAYSAVVVHSGAIIDPPKYNKEIAEIAKNSGGRIHACFNLDPGLNENSLPCSGNLYNRLMELRPAAIRMYPITEAYPFNDFFCGHILEVLNKLRLPLLFSETEIPPFQDIVSAAIAYPDIPIVILRNGFRASRTIIPMLTKLQNIYLDVSTLIDTGLLEELIDHFNMEDRLLIGSALPYHVPAGSLALVTYSKVEQIQKEKVLFGNWERLEGDILYDN